MRSYARYWPAALILIAGFAVVAYLAAGPGGMGSIAWAGGTVGVLTGIAIAAINGRGKG